MQTFWKSKRKVRKHSLVTIRKFSLQVRRVLIKFSEFLRGFSFCFYLFWYFIFLFALLVLFVRTVDIHASKTRDSTAVWSLSAREVRWAYIGNKFVFGEFLLVLIYLILFYYFYLFVLCAIYFTFLFGSLAPRIKTPYSSLVIYQVRQLSLNHFI